MTVATQQEPITFYSWGGRDAKGRAMPSSQIIHISGGDSQISKSGQMIRTPEKFAQFSNGHFTTSDPEIIEGLRKLMAKPGSCITDKREEYYEQTLTPEQKARRAQVENDSLKGENERLVEENNRMRQRLEQEGKNTSPRQRQSTETRT